MKKIFLFAIGLVLAAGMNAATIVVLDDLEANYQAHTGDVLTGRLQKNVHITIAHNATVTLRDAIIIGTNSRTYEWSGIDCQGNATIILEGTNSVRGFYEVFPGIGVSKDYTLTIEGNGTLIAASQGRGSGIGSGWSGLENLGGGYVRAYDGYCGNIIINGGNIYAYGGEGAAGIGNGYDSRCQSVTITPNVIKVYAEGGKNADYAIGGGWWCGSVKVDGKTYTNGIVGDASHHYTYTPWDGNLSTLNRDVVTTADGLYLYGTLNCASNPAKIIIPDHGKITLSNAKINGIDNSSYAWAGITCEGDATIALAGENTIRAFFQYYPAIHVPQGKTLTIEGTGILHALGGTAGAGIGGGYEINCGNILIKGGSVYAVGGNLAAGIGGGYKSQCGTITIANTVTKVYAAHGSNAQYSVGKGAQGSCGTITVGGVSQGSGITTNPFIYPSSTQEQEPQCTAPTNIKVSKKTACTATITWTAGAESVKFEVRYMHPLDPGYWYKSTTSTSYTITDLEPNTEYEVWVVAYCSTTNNSNYSPDSQHIRFTTGSAGQGIEQVPSDQVPSDQVPSDQVPSDKVIRNGQLYLMYGGRMYDVQGREVR